ncbi:hypothetical protein HQ585_10295 [candidate division KSB1 bacterium]|nr:hypothetical protein [candidate division KSB1 bacterium]
MAKYFGTEILGHYLYIRRFFTSLIGASLVGMNIGLPFYLPRSKSDVVKNSAFTIFIFLSIPIIVIFSYFISLSSSLAGKEVSILIYIMYGIGLNSQAITYARFRGEFKMFKASILQFTCVALIPFAIFFYSTDLANIFLLIGISTLIISSIGWIKNAISSTFTNKIKGTLNLLRFGIERIMGFFGQAALLTGIPIILANSVHINNLAYFNSSLSVFRFVLIILGPLSIILLPRISKAINEGIDSGILENLELLLYWTIIASWAVSFPLFIIGPEFLTLWLGGMVTYNISVISRIFLIIPLYAITVILRSPIDAASERGYNTVIYSISAIFMFIGYFIFDKIMDNYMLTAVLALSVGYLSAAVLSLYFVNKLLSVKIKPLKILKALGSYSFVSILIFITIEALIDSILIQLLVYGIISIFMILAYLYYSRGEYVSQLRNLFLKINNE